MVTETEEYCELVSRGVRLLFRGFDIISEHAGSDVFPSSFADEAGEVVWGEYLPECVHNIRLSLEFMPCEGSKAEDLRDRAVAQCWGLLTLMQFCPVSRVGVGVHMARVLREICWRLRHVSSRVSDVGAAVV